MKFKKLESVNDKPNVSTANLKPPSLPADISDFQTIEKIKRRICLSRSLER